MILLNFIAKIVNNKYLFLLALFISVILSNCNEEESQPNLNPKVNNSFNGTFKTIKSENTSGIVSLNISNGYYECFTNLPYGRGAGKLEMNAFKINFIDTLFFPIPAIYGPSYVLSGEHFYEFDGKHLKIRKKMNVGSIEYDLNLTDTN